MDKIGKDEVLLTPVVNMGWGMGYKCTICGSGANAPHAINHGSPRCVPTPAPTYKSMPNVEAGAQVFVVVDTQFDDPTAVVAVFSDESIAKSFCTQSAWLTILPFQLNVR